MNEQVESRRKSAAVNEQEAAALLRAADHILILSHMKPDGDTLGSAFAMCGALRALGKTVRVSCSDGFPARYSFLYGKADIEHQPDFEPEFVLAVDIASVALLGEQNAVWRDRIDLCIDHHPSNEQYAAHLLLDAEAAATAEVVYRVICELGVAFNRTIAAAIYTGVATDTGCFRYANTTAFTHKVAAEMLDAGIDGFGINRKMFELKTPGRIELERLVRGALEYYLDGKVALMLVTGEMTRSTGVSDEDMDGISSLPRQIEGVEAGVTVRQRADDTYRVSLRTGELVDASKVCARFGGGGHARAAGCTLTGTPDEVKRRLVDALRDVLVSD